MRGGRPRRSLRVDRLAARRTLREERGRPARGIADPDVEAGDLRPAVRAASESWGVLGGSRHGGVVGSVGAFVGARRRFLRRTGGRRTAKLGESETRTLPGGAFEPSDDRQTGRGYRKPRTAIPSTVDYEQVLPKATPIAPARRDRSAASALVPVAVVDRRRADGEDHGDLVALGVVERPVGAPWLGEEELVGPDGVLPVGRLDA